MNAPSFFFYDLETSGFDPRRQRIMQFAGQRTDMELNPIGDPLNILVTLADDVLPDPGAILVTGITPQKTQEEGYSEAEFLKILHQEVITPNTTIIGFNSVRFDDEFMRYTLYRNFYDPYEWQWQNGLSRWDLLDVVRMTRALRPDGIEWPLDAAGQPTNRLELLTKQNNLAHENAHDALSDVVGLIAVAKLIKTKQPKLFDYLYSVRGKQQVAELADLASPQPFVYTSGRYPKAHHHTTVAHPIAAGSKPGSIIVYDLRHDPELWANKSVDELKKIRFANYETRKQDGFMPLPAKELAFNRCPAVAPLGVLDGPAQERLLIELETVEKNLKKLHKSGIAELFAEVFRNEGFAKNNDVDGRLYDGFVGDADKIKMSAVRAADKSSLAGFDPAFKDERLQELLVRYKARNYPQSLSASERADWEKYRTKRVAADVEQFMKQLQAATKNATDHQQFLLEELQLWAQSIAPVGE